MSPLLEDIENMLGLSEDTPQPNIPAPKQTTNPNKERKASKQAAAKENMAPLNRSVLTISSGIPRPNTATVVPKIKKKKPVATF